MTARAGLLGLALLASLLTAAIALELDTAPSSEDATGIAPLRHAQLPAPRAAAAVPDDRRDDRSDDWAATALARPLFCRDRRPTPAAAAPDAAAPALAGLPRLTGIVLGPSGGTAIFAGTAGGKPVTVRQGDTVGPYRIEAIDSEGVHVSGPVKTPVLTVQPDAGGRNALAADAPPQPPPGIPGLPPGLPPTPFNAQQRQNLLNLRPGQFQRLMAAPPGAPATAPGSD